MKLFKYGVIGVLVANLMGCSDSKPSDKLAAATVRPYAEQSLLAGMELTDYKRDNGWADSDGDNLYRVQYTFNYQLKSPFGEVVLENARKLSEELATAKKNGNALSGGLNTMALMMASEMWASNQGDLLKPRIRAVLDKCGPCEKYVNAEDVGVDELKTRKLAFLSAMSMVENVGFTDDAKTGDKTPRHAWATFIKTEKGWQASH